MALCIFGQSVVFGQPLSDPLRGISVERLISEGGDIYTITITKALRNENPPCQYAYFGSVNHVYRSASLKASMEVSFVSNERFRIDDHLLVIINHHPGYSKSAARNDCAAHAKSQFGPRTFLLSRSETLEILRQGQDWYAFLPYRYFWSIAKPVTSRVTAIPNDGARYSLLRIADGRLDGDFIALSALLHGVEK